MNEIIIGMCIMLALIILTVGVVTYVICSIKAVNALNKLMDLYGPMFEKLKDYMDDM